MPRCCVLLLLLAGVGTPASAQVDFTGLPLDDAGRLRAETWDADRLSVVQEYQ